MAGEDVAIWAERRRIGVEKVEMKAEMDGSRRSEGSKWGYLGRSDQ